MDKTKRQGVLHEQELFDDIFEDIGIAVIAFAAGEELDRMRNAIRGQATG